MLWFLFDHSVVFVKNTFQFLLCQDHFPSPAMSRPMVLNIRITISVMHCFSDALLLAFPGRWLECRDVQLEVSWQTAIQQLRSSDAKVCFCTQWLPRLLSIVANSTIMSVPPKLSRKSPRKHFEMQISAAFREGRQEQVSGIVLQESDVNVTHLRMVFLAVQFAASDGCYPLCL